MLLEYMLKKSGNQVNDQKICMRVHKMESAFDKLLYVNFV